MSYVDGFVVPVPKSKLEEDRRVAARGHHAARLRRRREAQLAQVLDAADEAHPVLPLEDVAGAALGLDDDRCGRQRLQPRGRRTAARAVTLGRDDGRAVHLELHGAAAAREGRHRRGGRGIA